MNWQTKEMEFWKASLVGKWINDELDTLTFHTITERIFELGESSGREKEKEYAKFHFIANPQGAPFTAELQENGRYLVTRDGRTIREYTTTEMIEKFKYSGWEIYEPFEGERI